MEPGLTLYQYQCSPEGTERAFRITFATCDETRNDDIVKRVHEYVCKVFTELHKSVNESHPVAKRKVFGDSKIYLENVKTPEQYKRFHVDSTKNWQRAEFNYSCCKDCKTVIFNIYELKERNRRLNYDIKFR